MNRTRRIDPDRDDAVRTALQAILWVVCPGMFAAAAFLCGIDHPGARRAALASFVAAIVLSVLTLRWWRKPARHGHGAAALVIVILQLCLFAQLRAMPDPVLAGFQLLVVVGIATYILDPLWMLGLQLSGLLLWLAATGSVAATPQWQVARFVLAIGFVTAGAFYFGRRHSFDRQRELQREERRQRAASFESQEALRASERRLRDAQRIAHVGSYEWDVVADELHWSDEHYRIFGWEPGSAADIQRFVAAVHPEDRERIGRAVGRSLRDGTPVELEYRFTRPDGEERIVHGRGETERDAAGRAIRHQGTSYDVTEQQRVQRALEAGEARLTAILTAMDAARVVGVRRDGVVGSIVGTPDHTGRYGVGEDEVSGRRIHDFLPGEAGDRVMSAVARVYETGERAEVDATVEFPKGRFHFDVSLRALRSAAGGIESVLAIVRDMTDQRAEAEARRRAQKLESLGMLAGGVAHDFNNLLVGILGNAESALEALGPDSAARAPLEDIFRASSQAADLTQELLTYAGGARFSAASLDLFDLVEETAHLVRPKLPAGVTLDLAGDRGEIFVHADPAQIRQVVMNFVTNAAEAMAGA
ncbi:MAG: PAS domain-containing protein, partial [Myxococcales bacterium]|nr:PAS domain-containing protein [Myxococcales bacterium]